MATVTAKYLGDLRVECTHVASGTKLVSDAPVDNNGKGEAFSPRPLRDRPRVLRYDDHRHLRQDAQRGRCRNGKSKSLDHERQPAPHR